MLFFDQKPINEAYFGKTPDLLKAEKQLDKLRNINMSNYVFNPSINSDPDLIAFDRMMEKIFGLGCFTLKIINEPIANGFTIPIDYRFDAARDGNDLIADKNGFRFKKKFDYSLIMYSYSGVIFNPDFTTGEIMAMILHEIGHNFNSALNKKNGAMTNIYVMFTWYQLCVEFLSSPILFAMDLPTALRCYSNEFRKFADKKGREWRENGSGLIVLYDTYNWINDVVNTLGIALSEVVNVLTLGLLSSFMQLANIAIKFTSPAKIINFITGLFWLPSKYRNERTADNFAAMYGYGPEHISLMEKLSHEGSDVGKVTKGINKIPVLGALLHLNELPGLLLLTAFDEHPAAMQRCEDQLKLLKREVAKDDLDPKMKKVILADIKACEEQMDKFGKVKDGIKDPYIFKKKYEVLMHSLGMDIKNDLFDDKSKFDEYDRAFKRASEETENY